MTWASDKPTRPGWYWWRNSQAYRLDLAPEITMVFMRRKLLRAELMNGNKFRVMTMGGEWAGPLEPPEEEQ